MTPSTKKAERRRAQNPPRQPRVLSNDCDLGLGLILMFWLDMMKRKNKNNSKQRETFFYELVE